MTQIPPIGPVPDADVCFVGALLYASSADALSVLEHVLDDDVESPAMAAVLAAVRRLALSGKPTGPALVLDELRRVGQLRGGVADALRAATTSGADPTAATHYAAATVASSLRRRVESAGVALTAMAANGSEADILPIVSSAADACTRCAERLQHLRGDAA